ncbi:MAG: amidohydrolase family protein [bacterium]|nr:amidohydrolase family protein [bacterium]
MPPILFRNLSLLDPRRDEVRPGFEVLVEGNLIREVVEGPIQSESAEVVDCGGGTLMPGLIDCHAHVTLTELNLGAMEAMPVTLMTARAAKSLVDMLNRGFTTVRDTGGADWGIQEAVELGLLAGPRLFVSGQSIGPTGGHNDSRRRTDGGEGCSCSNALRFTAAVADGADGVRRVVREQLRQGANQIKIMCSGGVSSPYDPLDSLQFSLPEIEAAVEEATAFGRYVLAHAYTPEAITRAAHAGVRTIEHGNLIDDAAAELMAQSDMFLVANLVTYFSMKERAAALGMDAGMLAKNDIVLEGALRSLEVCKRAGVEVAFGSDLLGPLQEDQSLEFLHRAEVLSPIEIIRQATLVGARVVEREGSLGIIEPGAIADLLVVDGDPLADLRLLTNQGAHLAVIMKSGHFHKRTV